MAMIVLISSTSYYDQYLLLSHFNTELRYIIILLLQFCFQFEDIAVIITNTSVPSSVLQFYGFQITTTFSVSSPYLFTHYALHNPFPNHCCLTLNRVSDMHEPVPLSVCQRQYPCPIISYSGMKVPEVGLSWSDHLKEGRPISSQLWHNVEKTCWAPHRASEPAKIASCETPLSGSNQLNQYTPFNL